jgi:hypothetical protein
MVFPRLKHMHFGSVSFAFMRVCQVIIHLNKTQLWSHLMGFFFGVWLPFKGIT